MVVKIWSQILPIITLQFVHLLLAGELAAGALGGIISSSEDKLYPKQTQYRLHYMEVHREILTTNQSYNTFISIS